MTRKLSKRTMSKRSRSFSKAKLRADMVYMSDYTVCYVRAYTALCSMISWKVWDESWTDDLSCIIDEVENQVQTIDNHGVASTAGASQLGFLVHVTRPGRVIGSWPRTRIFRSSRNLGIHTLVNFGPTSLWVLYLSLSFCIRKGWFWISISTMSPTF